jgi:hypothetical protein
MGVKGGPAYPGQLDHFLDGDFFERPLLHQFAQRLPESGTGSADATIGPALYRLSRPLNFSDIRHRFVRNRMGNRYLTVAVEFCHA